MIKKVLFHIAFVTLISLKIFSQHNITWIKLDFTPGYLEEDGKDGFLDKSLYFVNEKLEEFNHTYQKTNLKRLFLHMQRGDFVGTNGLLKNPDREKFITYSVIAQIIFPNHIIIKKDFYSQISHLLNSKGEIPLYKLLNETELKLGTIPNRSFGGIIDQTLLANKGNPNIFETSLLTSANELFKAFSLDRYHYVIEYPVVANYLKSIGYITDEIVAIPIEGMPDHLNVYFSFPKNKWGENIRNQVNEILLKHRHTEEFLDYYGSWLDIDLRVKYTEIARKVFNQE